MAHDGSSATRLRAKQNAIIFKVTLPTLPISVNAAYATDWNTKRRFLTKKGGEFKKLVKAYAAIAIGSARFDKTKFYHLRIDFFMPLHFKNGNVRKWDVTNHVKALEDALVSVLGIDDCCFKSVWSEKHNIEHGKEERTEVVITPFELPFESKENP